jgi:hypothetical protein
MPAGSAFHLEVVNEVSDVLGKWRILLVGWLEGLCCHLIEEGVNKPYYLIQGEASIDVRAGDHVRKMGTVTCEHSCRRNEVVDGSEHDVLAVQNVICEVINVLKGTHDICLEKCFPIGIVDAKNVSTRIQAIVPSLYVRLA